MWTSWLQSSTVPALTQTLEFAEKRHNLLASNIANMDTPGYETRDISVDDFQNHLREAIDKTETHRYASPGISSAADDVAKSWEKARDVSKQVLFHDGHDISMEEQVTEAAKNQSLHSTAIALLRSQFNMLQMAISENVNV